jgi:hypothetical protein
MRKLRVRDDHKVEQDVSSEQTTALLVDEAVALDVEIKRMAKKLDIMKDKLKGMAKELGVKHDEGFEGVFGKATFEAVTEFDVTPERLKEWLRAHGRVKQFEQFVKVSNSEVRNKLGVEVLREAGTEITKLYHKVLLKER